MLPVEYYHEARASAVATAAHERPGGYGSAAASKAPNFQEPGFRDAATILHMSSTRTARRRGAGAISIGGNYAGIITYSTPRKTPASKR